MGSAPVSASLMAALHEALPHAAVTNAYGTTEAGPVVFGPHPHGLPQPELSVGYPHPKVSLRLVDGENRDAEQGVLEMKCPALMNGYHNRPDVAPPLTADGYYITGDVFRRDADGFHYFVGRTDDMFVSGGENIYPADVERMLERHPDIAQAAVVPVDDDIKGQQAGRLRHPQARPRARRRRGKALRACECAGLCASALRLVRRRIAARLDQQARPRGAAADGGGADGQKPLSRHSRRVSSSASADDPVSGNAKDKIADARITGCSAFAEHDKL